MSFFSKDQIIISNLLSYLSRFYPLSLDLMDAYQQNCEVLRVRKNKYILSPIDHNRFTYFIVYGKIRGFIMADGKDITTCFAFSQEFIAAIRHPASDELYSQEYLQAIEDGLLVCIPNTFIENICARYPEANVIGLKVQALLHFYALERSILARIPKATMRYKKLMQDVRMREAGIPMRYMASYLAIRMETLSRIRNKETSAALAPGILAEKE